LNRSDAGIHAALMITMVVWGLNLPLVKALTQWFDAQQIATLRMLVACTTYVGLMAWKHGRWPRFTPRQWVGLALCALCMVYGNQMLFATGMARTGAANAALVMATAPIVSGLLAAAAFGEAITDRPRLALAVDRHVGEVGLGHLHHLQVGRVALGIHLDMHRDRRAADARDARRSSAGRRSTPAA
jgi:hypothetical protein